jgi:ATP-dependent Clp protease adapter protein ClpS
VWHLSLDAQLTLTRFVQSVEHTKLLEPTLRDSRFLKVSSERVILYLLCREGCIGTVRIHLWFFKPRDVDIESTAGVEVESVSNTEIEQPFCIVLYNDDVNGIDYVVELLCRVLEIGKAESVWLAFKVHVTGRGRIWTGPKSEAEHKAGLIVQAGPDPRRIHAGAKPLRVTIEPAG